jgi:hypothetical protein
MVARVRIMWRGASPREDGAYDYTLTGVTKHGELVLLDQHSNTILWLPTSEREWCEFQCERCGRFAQYVAFGHAGATCFNADSDEACAEAQNCTRVDVTSGR